MNATTTITTVRSACAHAQPAVATDVKLYLIFSQSEAEATTIREGFWSNADGWGDFSTATHFTAAEREMFHLPSASGNDAVWVQVDQLRSFFADQQARAASAIVSGAPASESGAFACNIEWQVVGRPEGMLLS